MRIMITVVTPTTTAMTGSGSHWYLDPILESETCPSSMAVLAILMGLVVVEGVLGGGYSGEDSCDIFGQHLNLSKHWAVGAH